MISSDPTRTPPGSAVPGSAVPGLDVRELTLEVPLDRADPSRGSIEVFARVLSGVRAGGGRDGGAGGKPFLLYLQGGPGSEAPRATLEPASPPWLPCALEDFRVVMLDQRGTGRSMPVGLDLPMVLGSARTFAEASDAERAEHLACLRADAIVEDAEAVREALGAERWSVLGQSFGGFCALRYRSAHPGSLDRVLHTGGLPTVRGGAHGGDHDGALDSVYAATWEAMIAASEEFYRRFPGDRDRVRALMGLAADGAIRLPDGSRVGPERLRRIGHALGGSTGAERLHHLLELDHRGPAFRHDLAALLPFGGRNPLYAVLHESCWADGTATRWSAERTMPDAVREDPTLLAGEHVHRELFDEDPELAPWRGTAELLAERAWPRLYDVEALGGAGGADVPGAAAVYERDVYVPREASLATAGLVPALRTWVTSEYEHDGLRASGARVLDRLLALADGRAVR
ncbi:alpha/beta fold hydrolase [Brachybacterium huguangmaarense]